MARQRPAPGSRAETADRDARQWIDNDLGDDSIGMSPEMYARAADTPLLDADAHHYRRSITDTVLSPKLGT